MLCYLLFIYPSLHSLPWSQGLLAVFVQQSMSVASQISSLAAAGMSTGMRAPYPCRHPGGNGLRHGCNAVRVQALAAADGQVQPRSLFNLTPFVFRIRQYQVKCGLPQLRSTKAQCPLCLSQAPAVWYAAGWDQLMDFAD
jgi:hypothetical protein